MRLLTIKAPNSDSPQRMYEAELGPYMRKYGIASAERQSANDLVGRFGQTVYTCINIRANCAASVPLRLFSIGNKQQVEKSKRLKCKPLDRKTKAFLHGRMPVKCSPYVMKKIQGNQDDMTEITNHAVLDLFDNVNDQDEGWSFRHLMQVDMDVYGEHWWKLVANGPPDSIERLVPKLVNVIPSGREFMEGIRYGNPPNDVFFPADEVIWFRVPDPGDRWKAYGPLAAALKVIDGEYAMRAFQEDVFARGGMPEWILIDKKGTISTEPQKRAVRSQFRRLFGGVFGKMFKREEHLAVVSGDVELHKGSDNPKDLDFKESLTHTRNAIANSFGIPISFFESEGVVANSTEGRNQFNQNTIWPMCLRLEERWNQKLLPRWSDRLVLVHDNPMEENRAMVIQEAQAILTIGGTVNQALTLMGYEESDDPNAEVPMVSSGVKPLEQAVNPPDPLGLGGAFGNIPGDGGNPRNPDSDEDKPPKPTGGGGGSDDESDKGIRHSQGTLSSQATQGLGRMSGVHSSVGKSGGGNDGNGTGDNSGGDVDAQTTGDTHCAGCTCGHSHKRNGRESLGYDEPRAGNTVKQSEIWCGKDSLGIVDSVLHGGDDYCCSSFVQRCLVEHKAVEPQEGLPEDGSVRGFVTRMEKTLRKQIDEATAAMRAAGTPEAAVADFLRVVQDPKFIGDIAQAARPFLERAITIGGTFGAEKLSQQLPEAIGFDVTNPEVQRFVDNYSVRFATQVNGTTIVRAKEILGDGLQQGETIPQLTERVQDWAGKAGDATRGTGARAEMIARTESARAYEKGQIEAWKQSGVVEGKQWLLAPDACEFCEAISKEYANKTVSLAGVFRSKGTVLQGTQGGVMTLDYEDIDSPPLHPQCRCDTIPVLMEVE